MLPVQIDKQEDFISLRLFAFIWHNTLILRPNDLWSPNPHIVRLGCLWYNWQRICLYHSISMNAGNKKHNEKDNEMVQLTKIILKQTARHSKKSLTFQKSSKKLFLHWRANLADQNKHQPLKIDIRVTDLTVLSVWNTPLIDTCQHCSTSRANQALRLLANAGFQNRGVSWGPSRP